jgi:hypothetical protein
LDLSLISDKPGRHLSIPGGGTISISVSLYLAFKPPGLFAFLTPLVLQGCDNFLKIVYMRTVKLCLLCFSVTVAAQQPKSVTPLPAIASAKAGTPHSTSAVVVGISDYQDPAIPNLGFADKDAEAFADFLRSPAGGSLNDDILQKVAEGEDGGQGAKNDDPGGISFSAKGHAGEVP